MKAKKKLEQEIESRLSNQRFARIRLRREFNDSSDEASASIIGKIEELKEMDKLANARLNSLHDNTKSNEKT